MDWIGNDKEVWYYEEDITKEENEDYIKRVL